MFAEDREAERERLEQELERLEREIAEKEQDITATEEEKRTLRNRIAQLENEIGYLSSQIERNELIIQDLGSEIESTEQSIQETTRKIEESKEELSEVLRTMYMEDRASTVEILLVEEDLSSVFNNLNSLQRLSEETRSILDDVRDMRSSLAGYKEDLQEDQEEARRTAQIMEAQKEQEEAARRRQEDLYEMTEEEYQEYVAEKERLEERKEEINQRLVELVGIPDVDMPTFEEAVDVAEWVHGHTGIRPAFLLSIIMQESALGRNVGQCYIADTSSGASRHINTGQTFSNGIATPANGANRDDLSIFLTITSELGRDPHETPVSCPMSYGYGGAMGPAQFIPSTWQSVRSSVSNTLGREPDPWEVSDSFLASGTLLRDLGGVNNERRAALQYFAGSNWQASHVQFYGDQTMQRTECIQTFLNEGTMSARCDDLVFMPN